MLVSTLGIPSGGFPLASRDCVPWVVTKADQPSSLEVRWNSEAVSSIADSLLLVSTGWPVIHISAG